MPKSICDFCSSPNVTWVYPARTFAAYVFEGIVGESVGDSRCRATVIKKLCPHEFLPAATTAVRRDLEHSSATRGRSVW